MDWQSGLYFLGNTLMSKRKCKKIKKVLDKQNQLCYTIEAPQEQSEKSKSHLVLRGIYNWVLGNTKMSKRKVKKVLDKQKRMWYTK